MKLESISIIVNFFDKEGDRQSTYKTSKDFNGAQAQLYSLEEMFKDENNS